MRIISKEFKTYEIYMMLEKLFYICQSKLTHPNLIPFIMNVFLGEMKQKFKIGEASWVHLENATSSIQKDCLTLMKDFFRRCEIS